MSRVYVLTRDPTHGGGAPQMAYSVYDLAEDLGHDPCLAYQSFDPSRTLKLSRPRSSLCTLRREPHNLDVVETEVKGHEAKSLPFVAPEIEPTQFLLTRRWWERVLADADATILASGTGLPGLPGAMHDAPFGAWIATPYWPDRVDRLRESGWVERSRDRLSKPVLDYLERRVVRRADVAAGLSRYTADALADRAGVPVRTCPPPIDTKVFSLDGPTRERPLSHDGPTIGFVGRLDDPRKCVPRLCRAVGQLIPDYPGLDCLLIGRSADLFGTWLSNLEHAKHIANPGIVPHDDLPGWYRGMDAFVVPSNQEGLCLAGLEAMACGTPVVSTRCGGPEEYVDERALADRSEQSLTETIRRVLSDDTLRDELQADARWQIEDRYAESVVRRRLTDLISDVVDGERPSPTDRPRPVAPCG